MISRLSMFQSLLSASIHTIRRAEAFVLVKLSGREMLAREIQEGRWFAKVQMIRINGIWQESSAMAKVKLLKARDF